MITEMTSYVTMAFIFLELLSCRAEILGATAGFLRKYEHLPGGHYTAPPMLMMLRGGMWKGQSSTPDEKVFTKADQVLCHIPMMLISKLGEVWVMCSGYDSVNFCLSKPIFPQDDLNRYAGLNLRSKELMLELEDSQGILDGLKMSKDEVALMDPKDPDFKYVALRSSNHH